MGGHWESRFGDLGMRCLPGRVWVHECMYVCMYVCMYREGMEMEIEIEINEV